VFDEFAALIEHRQRFTFIDFALHCRHQCSQLIIVCCRELRVPQRLIGYDGFECFFGGQRMCFEEERELIELHCSCQRQSCSDVSNGLHQVCLGLLFHHHFSHSP
jgi:hypothetical protein